jgi:phosphoribosylformylglycinamidine cyclo-ligase
LARTYKEAGVDIVAGMKVVEMIKPAVAETWRPGVISGLGGFAGLFTPDLQKYRDPVLVSGTDGVGTKLRLAFLLDKHDTIGQDVVAMCVNDILTVGAEPLFFLDYLAVGKVEPTRAATIIRGVAAACKESGCALIGGETAEMPGFYAEKEYDIAGFAVGIVDREKLIDGSSIREGDLLVGLFSNGMHSNGFSLVRQIFVPEMLVQPLPGSTQPLGESLLTPTRIYVRTVLSLLEKFDLHGLAHITGGGLTENIPRVLPNGLGVEIDPAAWQVPQIFQALQKEGGLSLEEMRRTFNMGIGFILIIPPSDEGAVLAALGEAGEGRAVIGRVTKGTGVRYL